MGNGTNMIAACPKCRARYRVDAGRLQPEGVRLRCSQCDAVFRVTPPVVETPQPRPAAPSADAEPPRNGGPSIVVADADIDAGKRTAQALTEWGYAPMLVHDGVEAILSIQRQLPQAVVLDAGLTKMFGYQICELMKRNESLSSIPVVLVGTIHHEARYRREPNELYGADAYLERPQLPEALRTVLRGFGLPGGAAPPAATSPVSESAQSAPEPASAPEPPPLAPDPVLAPSPPSPEPAPQADEPAPTLVASAVSSSETPEAAPSAMADAAPSAAGESGESAEQIAARRLARIIVSDIVLYNAEKFDAAVSSGDVVAALAAELDEGRALLAQRVAARLRSECDFVAEELVRVARERGMSG
ncbi:MAG: zinc-ribbon domain-containing protein [Deltaproteobacteria bacterium]|nr:zinc-ribbon domain-containing protein [Deltaproteobacteria bacterium]MBW2360385.1 zinc-ribbon domain-containing protein [Deltaproteobacteria bacterium]